MQYVADLLTAAADGASRIVMIITVIFGVLIGLGVGSIESTNLAASALIGGVLAFALYVLVIGPYRLVQEARNDAQDQGQSYVTTHIENQINVSFQFPNGVQVPSGSATYISGPEGEGFLVPPGTVPSAFTADAVIVKPYEPPEDD